MTPVQLRILPADVPSPFRLSSFPQPNQVDLDSDQYWSANINEFRKIVDAIEILKFLATSMRLYSAEYAKKDLFHKVSPLLQRHRNQLVMHFSTLERLAVRVSSLKTYFESINKYLIVQRYLLKYTTTLFKTFLRYQETISLETLVTKRLEDTKREIAYLIYSLDSNKGEDIGRIASARIYFSCPDLTLDRFTARPSRHQDYNGDFIDALELGLLTQPLAISLNNHCFTDVPSAGEDYNLVFRVITTSPRSTPCEQLQSFLQHNQLFISTLMANLVLCRGRLAYFHSQYSVLIPELIKFKESTQHDMRKAWSIQELDRQQQECTDKIAVAVRKERSFRQKLPELSSILAFVQRTIEQTTNAAERPTLHTIESDLIALIQTFQNRVDVFKTEISSFQASLDSFSRQIYTRE